VILLSDLIDENFEYETNNEKLVSLHTIKTIYIDETRKQIANKSDYFCFVRESLYERIEKASNLISKKYSYLIKEAYRPILTQENAYNWICNKIRNENNQLSENQIIQKASLFVAPVKVAGHPTGGAIDLTLIEDGKEVFMGTEYNENPNNTNTNTFFHSNNIEDRIMELRQIMAEPLIRNDLLNYEPEWWHWSFGDPYWAYINKKKVKYKPIMEN
jgi:zinc D-Ala-D-Ala dipeptidase